MPFHYGDRLRGHGAPRRASEVPRNYRCVSVISHKLCFAECLQGPVPQCMGYRMVRSQSAPIEHLLINAQRHRTTHRRRLRKLWCLALAVLPQSPPVRLLDDCVSARTYPAVQAEGGGSENGLDVSLPSQQRLIGLLIPLSM